jgi:hypothetical protein
VLVFHAERTKDLLTPPQEQQAPARATELIRTHAAVHAPVVVEARSFKPKVGSMDTTSPTL